MERPTCSSSNPAPCQAAQAAIAAAQTAIVTTRQGVNWRPMKLSHGVERHLIQDNYRLETALESFLQYKFSLGQGPFVGINQQ